MREELYMVEIKKIKEMWPQAYNDVRIKVVWEIVRKESDYWFSNLCRSFLIHQTKAPLPADFLEAVRLENRAREIKSFASLDEISPMKDSIFSREDVAEMFGMIKKCMNGEITGEELREYGKLVEAAVKNKGKLSCKWNCREGVVFAKKINTSYEYVFKCPCIKGMGNQLNHSMWQENFTHQYTLDI